MSHDDVKIMFINNQLVIKKKNEGEPGTVILTQRWWREEKAKLKYKQIKAVGIKKVNVKEACKDMFTFIATCTNSKRLTIVNAKDGTGNNSELSCKLCEVLDKLHRLLQLNISDIDLSEGGRQVLSSISHLISGF